VREKNAREAMVCVVVLFAGLTVGCGTIASRMDSTAYSGVALDAKVIGAGVAGAVTADETGILILAVPFCLIDLPLSLVADTLLLPVTSREQFGSQRKDQKALVAALEAGDLARAKVIAEKTPEVLRLEADLGRAPLHLAVEKGQADLVEWLASETAADNAEDVNGETALNLAVHAGRTDLARILLDRGADLNHRGRDSTPLHQAAALEDPALTELLLDRGASVDARSERAMTPLHVAAGRGRTPVAALLIARGADVDARDHRGATPLHVAASQGHLAVARVLVSHGADIDARSDDWDGGWLGIFEERGTTPLGEALRRRHAELAELLRSQGGVE
jgi:ankyrin repeat protein/uncharacterized protein YceK